VKDDPKKGLERIPLRKSIYRLQKVKEDLKNIRTIVSGLRGDATPVNFDVIKNTIGNVKEWLRTRIFNH